MKPIQNIFKKNPAEHIYENLSMQYRDIFKVVKN